MVAFEIGADDYVSKPFSVRELMLRVRALLRRSNGTKVIAPIAGAQFARLRVDPDAHQVWVDGEEIALTALEFRLIHTLLSRRGRVQTRTQLLEDVWGVHADVTTRTVDSSATRARMWRPSVAWAIAFAQRAVRSPSPQPLAHQSSAPGEVDDHRLVIVADGS